MADELKTPAFAIVGAVNHGKSSVVSTLAENDGVRVSPLPGETVECQRFSLRDLFVFYDTPGFQNAIEALPELQPAAQAREPLQIFRAFIAQHRREPEFAAECRLFAPVVGGAGIIYVVDGSRPLLDLNLAEMEILRLTGQPRLAIINRSGADDHVPDWKRRLGQHFNAVREFNAHRATFADRIELLEALANIEQSWKPNLSRAIALMNEEWTGRIGECAEIIVELLCDALRHREVSGATEGGEAKRAALAEELKTRYLQAVSAIETRAQTRIIGLFEHNLVKAEANTEHLFGSDLFSDETWKLFGLGEDQLFFAATISGAVAGLGADALTLGHSFGLFALAGGAFGAGTALVIGRQRPALSVAMPHGGWLPKPLSALLPRRVQLGGSALVVGPYRAINFPWILLDRAIGTFAYVINRAHARRDESTLRVSMLKAAMEKHGLTSSQWNDEKRKACEKLFASIRQEKFDRAECEKLRGLIRERLLEVSARRMEF